MAACLWKVARNLYCKLPFVECSRLPPVKTCFDLWKEALATNLVAIRQFFVVTVFVSIEFVKDLFLDVICKVPGVTCDAVKPPPPKKEDLYSWVVSSLVECGRSVLIMIAALVQTIVFRPALWLFRNDIFQSMVIFLVLSFVVLKVFKVMRNRLNKNTPNTPSAGVALHLDQVTIRN